MGLWIGWWNDATFVVRKLSKRFCKPSDMKFAYPTFKIKNLFNVKDPFPDRLSARIGVQIFLCEL